jgi:hypothetical protein
VLHWFLVTAIILLVVVAVVFGGLFFLSRFRGGRYLQKLGLLMAKVPFLRRQLVKMNQAIIERQNPELASAMRKLNRVANADVKKQAQAFQTLSPEEKRAYQELVDKQGGGPEPANRQMRRAQERLAQSNRAQPSRGGRPSSKRGKKR